MDMVKIVNIILAGLLIILAVNLVQPLSAITGNIIFDLDTSEPQCLFHYSGEFNQIPADRCCYEIKSQLACTALDEKNIKCYVSAASEKYYLINQKLLRYCAREGYDVKIG
jgi:hypothetical protein